jgi:hypothetical protein
MKEIQIQKCPYCGDSHTYSLFVKKYSRFKYIISSGQDEEPIIRKFRRVFVCPIEDKRFQAIISIPQHQREIVEDLIIGDAIV